MNETREILDKYSLDVLKNIKTENIRDIVNFLLDNNCEYYDELLEDYLDLFTFNINEFEIKFNRINKKYDNKFIEYASHNMNLFEEFYND